YDSQGNRTTITTAGPGSTTTTLTYDQANRLTTYGTAATYTYNGDGLRTAKTVNNTPTTFTWDPNETLPLHLTDNTDQYIYGPTGQPIEKINGATITYLHQDQQGSTRLLTNDTGAVAGTYTYDPYGNITSHTGSATTPIQYDAQYTDTETGYQYLRTRYYDPVTGQFLSRDPITAATGQPYEYANNDPLTEADPTGLCWGPGCWIESAANTVANSARTAWDATGGRVVAAVSDVIDNVRLPDY